MYSACLFCNQSLGTNEVIELFPVGRRLAFDAATGRLWVVCRSCERWNLTPLEERWEVIETCERRFTQTRLRTSTENIGLARLPEGLDLVRIGKPLRPEFAAWRYGDQFGRRRRASFVRAGVGVGAVGALLLGGAAAGIAIGGFAGIWTQLVRRAVEGDPDAVIARIPVAGRRIPIKRKHLKNVQFVRADDGWRLKIPDGKAAIDLSRDDTERAVALLMPPINRYGGKPAVITEAVGLIERAGHPEIYLQQAGTFALNRQTTALIKLPSPMRLALEMATHEEAERRALEGELAALESAWREAEEIAAISDSLLTPSWIDQAIRRIRG